MQGLRASTSNVCFDLTPLWSGAFTKVYCLGIQHEVRYEVQ